LKLTKLNFVNQKNSFGNKQNETPGKIGFKKISAQSSSSSKGIINLSSNPNNLINRLSNPKQINVKKDSSLQTNKKSKLSDKNIISTSGNANTPRGGINGNNSNAIKKKK
jgi:hypothetical protein